MLVYFGVGVCLTGTFCDKDFIRVRIVNQWLTSTVVGYGFSPLTVESGHFQNPIPLFIQYSSTPLDYRYYISYVCTTPSRSGVMGTIRTGSVPILDGQSELAYKQSDKVRCDRDCFGCYSIHKLVIRISEHRYLEAHPLTIILLPRPK
jgi:hypothetical protein